MWKTIGNAGFSLCVQKNISPYVSYICTAGPVFAVGF